MDSRFDRAELARDLRNQSPSIMASLLFCDFLELRREIEAVEEAGAAAMHLDVMDGHFVPNFTYGMTIVEAARRATDKPIDCHLMMDNPGRYVEDFRRAGTACLDLAWVAAGRLDGYFEIGLKPWDVAAGALIVREAGGVVLNFDGDDDVENSGTLIAAPYKIMTPLRQIIHSRWK